MKLIIHKTDAFQNFSHINREPLVNKSIVINLTCVSTVEVLYLTKIYYDTYNYNKYVVHSKRNEPFTFAHEFNLPCTSRLNYTKKNR